MKEKMIYPESTLKPTWDLKNEISNLSISTDLKKEIDLYISYNDSKFTGRLAFERPFSNIIYRGNLHYIIDNIEKQGLVDELKNYNLLVNKTKI